MIAELRDERNFVINDDVAISFRPIELTDYDEIKALHEEFFPVRYADAFYDEAVRGVGIGGEPLFTLIAVVPSEKKEDGSSGSTIVGFILAQLMITDYCEEKSLFYATNKPAKLFYILTLGVKQQFRKFGLATTLVQRCVDVQNSEPVLFYAFIMI